MSNGSNPRIVWSADGEDFSRDDLGEVLDWLAGDEEVEPGRVVYFAEAMTPTVVHVSAGDVIDMIGDRGCDEGGEHAEGFPEVSDEAVAELDAFLRAWQAKHCKPNWWRVQNVQPYTITAEDLERRDD